MTPQLAAQLVEDLRGIPSRVRLKERSGATYDWSWPLFSPSPSYLDTAGSGPLELSRIECIDVEREEKKHRGGLIPPAVIDHTDEIEALLTKRGLMFQPADTYIRISA